MNNQTSKTPEVKQTKRINMHVNEIQHKIQSTYSLLTELESQLYPVLEVLEDEDCSVDEAQPESAKLDEKLNNIGIDISQVNDRIKILLDTLMIERF